MEEFITILKNETAEIVEKKSKFIANLFHVESVEEAENRIKDIKMGRLMTIKAENIVINLLIFCYRQIHRIGV